MPSRMTVIRWLSSGKHPEFVTIYAQAREAQADFLAEEILQIADTTETGTKSTSKEWGDEVTEADMIEHRKLKVATRQWLAERIAPKRWGAKQQVEMSGQLAITDMTEDEMRAELAALGMAGGALGPEDVSDLV